MSARVQASMVGAVALLALCAGGCATIDIYTYQPRPLPAGTQPLAVVAWSLHDLRNVSWEYGVADPDPTRRAELEARRGGLYGHAEGDLHDGSPLDLSYREIAEGVRQITQLHGLWTVFIYDRHNRLVQLEFNSYAAARLFLDASSAIATTNI